MQTLSPRRLTVLASLLICAALLPAFTSQSAAQSVSWSGQDTAAPLVRLEAIPSAASSSAGYNCVPLARLVTAKASQPGTLSVRLGGFELTYTGKEAHLATGLFAYPGTMAVTEANNTWTMPRPGRPQGRIFRTGWFVRGPGRLGHATRRAG